MAGEADVCRPACGHYKTVLHGAVEFQPPCSPDLSPLDFFYGTTSRHSSTSVQLLPTPQKCGHSRPACVRRRGQAAAGCSKRWVLHGIRRVKASVAAEQVIVRLNIAPVTDTAQKTSIATTDTDNTTDNTCLPELGPSPRSSNGPWGSC